MSGYLEELQMSTLRYDVDYLITECKRRYKAAALLVGHYDDFIKKLDDSNTHYSKTVDRIVWEIYDRYRKDHNDLQLDIFEPFVIMVWRRWYDFTSKIWNALAEDDTFCRCFIRVAYFYDTSTFNDDFKIALQIAKDIDLRIYLSDEPRKMDEEE